LELFLPLTVGATVILVDRVTATDGIHLAKVIQQSGATIMQATPSTWRLLLAAQWTGSKELKILCGGESWTRELANELQARSKEVWNMYGPTETTIWSAIHHVSEQEGPIRIGQPIHNTRMYVLDAAMQPMPIGVPGELYIGGDGVAQGYLHRPDLTAERFMEDPFYSQGRMYRTGDLARYDQDGILECLGRVDQQVKIRGYRIELPEIENVISQHPAISETAVVARTETNGEVRLLGFLVGVSELLLPGDQEMRKYCRSFLPEYMVPSVFIEMDQLPLTPNGKIDRMLLMSDVIEPEKYGESTDLPRNETEKKLADIWKNVLGHGNIRVYDNFFEIGGQSLLATQMMIRVQNMFQINLTLRIIFNYPSIEALSTYILSQITHVLKEQEKPIISSTEKSNLSYSQKRAWFLDELIQEKALYNVPYALQISGNLQKETLKKCIHIVVNRHEVLRTAFVSVDGYPAAKIEEAKVPFGYFDLTTLPDRDKEDNVHYLLNQLVHKPFILSSPPLFHVMLIQLETHKYILGLVFHHIISDAWSIDLFMKEISFLYENELVQGSAELEYLPAQYGDYTNWEQTKIEIGGLKDHIHYWKEQLHGHAPVLMLPTDFMRPKVPSYNGAKHRFVLSKQLTKSIKVLGTQHGCSLYMTLLAAFEILCFRYTGQTDFSIGSPISNRTHVEIEKLIGFFVNTLVIRADLSGDPTFLEVLKIVRKVALEAYEHQEMPFDKLVEIIQPERNPGYTPLFQVMFQLAPQADVKMSNFTIEEVPLEATTAKFDINLHIFEKEDVLLGELIYRTDLFGAERIQQLTLHFEQLLSSIVHDPQMKISQLRLLTDSELQNGAITSNKQPLKPLYESNIVKLFEEQVERTPLNMAVMAENLSLTYYDLNKRANQIAHYLQQKGIVEETFVGICMERSVEMFVVLLGVGKAGGAYVLLDPSNPLEELKNLIDDSKASIVLTDQLHVYETFCDTVQIIAMNNAEVKLNINEKVQTNPNNYSQMNHPVYLSYTSGSKGEPKGVVVEHQNLVNYINGTKDVICLGADASYATVSAFTADLGNTMFFHSLTSGGTLHVIENERISDPDALAAYFQQNRIDCLQISPSQMEVLLSGSNPENVLPKRRIVLGGEALNWGLVDKIWNFNPKCEIINHYGSTETTIGVATYTLNPDTPRISHTVPLGHPIFNTEFFILDTSQGLVPQGVQGELYVEGQSVSRGYFGKEELTARQFITYYHPHQKNKRLYRTGDLVRQLSDGSIEYLGRTDDQVVIRGCRVDLFEIASAYQKHPEIYFSLVTLQEEMGITNTLASYLVVNENKIVSVEQLRQFGMEYLPSFMVPTKYYILDGIPLGINGKLDRRALPIKRIEITDQEQHEQSHTSDEEKLLTIWSELLDISRTEINVHDDFFSLGGHSLIATQMISRIRKEWQSTVPLSLIFEYPTISSLSSHISSSCTGLNKPVFEKKDIDHNKVQKLSHAQLRLWFLDQLEGNTALYNDPKVIRLRGMLNVEYFIKSLREIMDRHHILRTIYQEINGEPWQLTLEETELFITQVDWQNQSDLAIDATKKYLTEEAKKPFDLRKGPLVKTYLVRTGEQEYWFMLNFHHIVTDAWSTTIIFREIEKLYSMYTTQSSTMCLDAPTQYSEFSEWERLWLDGDYIENQIDYWKQQLSESKANVSFPTDINRPNPLTTKGATEFLSVPDNIYKDLISFSRNQGVSLFMTTLSAFGILLYMLTEEEDFCIGTPIANRTDKETEDIVGFFVNTLVIRMNLTSNPTFEEILRNIQRTTLEAYAHQEVPFEKLVERLLEERNPSYSAFFQIMFETSQALSINLPDVIVTPEYIDLGTSKFDLSVNLIEQNDDLVIEMEYNADLFAKETILQYFNKYINIIRIAVEHPEYRLKEFNHIQTVVSQEDLEDLWI
jgi:amino acid adenylation domain-containing protein